MGTTAQIHDHVVRHRGIDRADGGLRGGHRLERGCETRPWVGVAPVDGVDIEIGHGGECRLSRDEERRREGGGSDH